MLGSAQVRACFAEKTVLCRKGFLAKCSGPHRSAPNLPRKSWSVPGFWTNAPVRSSVPVLPRTPCSVLVPAQNAFRSAGSRFRSTGSQNARKQQQSGHYTPSAVVKCKFPLSELRGEATYRAVAGSRFPSTMPLHLEESFEYRFYSRSM